MLKIQLISDNATLPTKGSEGAAGFDIYSCESKVVPSKGKCLINTDLKIQVPEGTYGRIAPRSGLAVRNFIDVGAGVIDADYRGILQVLLFNLSDEDFVVSKGDRIAQLILEKIAYTSIVQVDKLDDTVRGQGGFGSTGV